MVQQPSPSWQLAPCIVQHAHCMMHDAIVASRPRLRALCSWHLAPGIVQHLHCRSFIVRWYLKLTVGRSQGVGRVHNRQKFVQDPQNWKAHWIGTTCACYKYLTLVSSMCALLLRIIARHALTSLLNALRSKGPPERWRLSQDRREERRLSIVFVRISCLVS